MDNTNVMNKKYIKLNIDGWHTQDKEYAKRFNGSLTTQEDKHHEIAEYYIGAMTNKYRNTDTMSLDEFLCEYSDNMEYEDVKLGESILNLF